MRRLALLVLVASCAPPPSTSLYDGPWPDERLRDENGEIDVSSFPEGTGSVLRAQSIAALRGASGFGLTSAIFFPLEAPLDPGVLPDVAASVRADASVQLVNVDIDSREYGRRAPIDVRVIDDAGPFGGTDLLVVLPYPGIPLAPSTLYAAVVTDAVSNEGVGPLASTAITDAHREADARLAELGLPRERVLARAVIRTGNPVEELSRAVDRALDEEPIAIDPPTLSEVYDDFCVFSSETTMPVYQTGEPPYASDGGGWAYGSDGELVVQSRLRSRIWITVPRRELRERAPAAVFVRAGGGGDRPLIDRGRRDAEGRSEPGTGVARELARAGYVGLSVDGPLGGARNEEGWDEQTAVFNVLNPAALRDNVRQTALELVLFVHAAGGMRVDASACRGADAEIQLDDDMVLIAHSTGATIAPLAFAIEPRFRALAMSGAGGSWIRQVNFKESPMPMAPLAQLLFGYWPDVPMREHDPLLSLVTWAGETAEPVIFASQTPDRPVLIFQGVPDTYIPPPIANPVALSFHARRSGEALDARVPYTTLDEDAALLGLTPLDLPRALAPNDRAVVQHAADGIEDGHEVLFQVDAARHQLQCFLRSLADGSPRGVA
ncbi:MAG: hypothetical protein AB7S26_41660, partial [Sandaracinaceae bacterium]